MTNSIRTIAVDLTPITQGGENGGAKIFVLELLRRLADIAPQTHFILLTHAASHQELAGLDCQNIQRLLVIRPTAKSYFLSQLSGIAGHMLSRLPVRMRDAIYKYKSILKHRGADALLKGIGAELLFCPFTAPTYYDPSIPIVCVIYDLQYKTYPEFFGAEDLAHRDRSFLGACRRATVLTAISEYARKSAIAHGSLDPTRIRTIRLRMAQRFPARLDEDTEVLQRLCITPKQYLLYPANFWRHKNHEVLLTAFGMACRNGLAPEIKLVCPGTPGSRQQSLIRAAHAMGLGERILFPGYLATVELGVVLANCAGLIFPSLYEGFGLPVIEAMAAGVPVACSNTTALPEVVTDAAVLFDPHMPAEIAQAMVLIVKDKALRTQLIQAGYRRATEFADPTLMAAEYWELFQSAVAH
jgi:glycosyltransferase involved in cell wall biosynthesis